jgi:polysaccharide deacetylase family protein (PEP-CTERM system associated)
MTRSDPAPHPHIFSVDVEEYFQVSAFEGVVSRRDWPSYASRVDRGVGAILTLLDRHGTTGTFFCLGWLAQANPGVVRRIADAGHEIASHGWWHRRIGSLSPREFRDDVRDSRRLLEDITGQPVIGFRAPSFSLVPGLEWAFEVLLEEGYRYDSSLFPIRRPGYGYPGAPTAPHLRSTPSGAIVEFPLTTARIAGIEIPAAGGGYFRQFPYALTRHAFRQCQAEGRTGTFYIHPWELDEAQPRLPVSWFTTLRHYRGIAATQARLERLLSDFRFTSAARRCEWRDLRAGAAVPVGATSSW